MADFDNERSRLLSQIEDLKSQIKEIQGDGRLDEAKQENELLREQLKLRQRLIDLEVERFKELKKSGVIDQQAFDQSIEAARNQEASYAKQQAAIDKRSRSIGREAKSLETTDALVDSIGTKFGLSTSKAGGMSKQIFNAWKGMVKLDGFTKGTAKLFRNLADSVLSAVHPMNILESLASAIWKESIEYFFRIDEAISKMNATIADGGKTARAAGKAVRFGMGVDIEQATAAAGGLASSFTAFTSMNEKAKTSLIGMSAELERVGLGAGESGKGMNFLTRSMGMTAKKGVKVWKGLAASASAFGKTVPEMSSDFMSASKVLMAHGPKMISVFKDLEATAMASGLALDTLLSVAGKFDTFDSAAGAVGNLNALLGGDYLNTLEMMNMTENERISALKGSLEMAGKNFDQMERFERKAIAEQMGMDEAQLAQMMNASGKEARKARREAKKREKDQKAYNRMVKSTVSITEKLRMLFTSIFAHTGLMQMFGKAFGELFKQLRPGAPLGKGIRELTGFIGDLMAAGIAIGIRWFKKLIGTGGELTLKIKEWKGNLKEFWKAFKKGGPEADAAMEKLKGQIKDTILEFTGMKDVFTGETAQENFKLGVKKFVKYIKGPTFTPVRKAFASLVIEPLGQALETVGKHMAETAGVNFVQQGLGETIQSMGTGFKIAGIEFGKEMDKIPEQTEEMVTKANKAVGKGSPAKKFIELGKSINDGFKIGLKPGSFIKMFDELIESTDSWAESLKEVADQVGDIAFATSGQGGKGGISSRVVLELDGKVLAEYVIDTVNKRARRLAIPG